MICLRECSGECKIFNRLHVTQGRLYFTNKKINILRNQKIKNTNFLISQKFGNVRHSRYPTVSNTTNFSEKKDFFLIISFIFSDKFNKFSFFFASRDTNYFYCLFGLPFN